MTHLTDVLKQALSLFPDNNKKQPLHVGEVMNLWFYVTALKEMLIFMEMALNNTTDKELLEAVNKSYDDCNKHVNKIINFLKKEGVPLPPTGEDKPKSNPNDIPLGVKWTDDEIANLLSVKTVAAIMTCSTGICQSVRNDVSAIWLECLMKKIEFGAYLKPIMEKRGWLKVPPYYYPPGKQNQ